MANTRFQKTPLHYIQYLALKWFCVLFGLLPYKTAVWLGRKATGAVRFVMKKRFNRSVYDIRCAFPKMTEEEARATALESWRNMGGILAEFIKLTQMTPEEFKKHSRIIGAEKMLNAQNVTGGIIHIGHFTNWEAFGLAGAVYGVDKAVLAQRVDNPYVDEETNRLRNIFTGRTFYSNNDFIAYACISFLGTTKNTDTKHFSSTAVVGYGQSTLLLYHDYFALSMISTNLHLLVLLKGRVSIILTVSPMLHSFFSS